MQRVRSAWARCASGLRVLEGGARYTEWAEERGAYGYPSYGTYSASVHAENFALPTLAQKAHLPHPRRL